MKLIIATTPYQIFNAILFRQSLDEEMSIYISDFASANCQIADRLKKKEIFNGVFFVKHGGRRIEPIRETLTDYFQKIKTKINHMFFYNKNYIKLCGHADKNTFYDEIIIDVPNFMQRTVISHFMSLNKQLSISMMDVGLESYMKADQIENGTDKFPVKNLYIHCASMFSSKNGVIKSLSKTFDLQLINEIFDYDGTTFDSYDNIFFDQYMEPYQDNFAKVCFDDIVRTLKGKTILKNHPKRDKIFVSGIETIHTLTAFEVILSNSNSDYSDKVVASLNSTSLALPKLLFDKEPFIICLCRLNPYKTREYKQINDFFIHLKNSYRDKNKVIIPADISELEQAIRYINGRRGIEK